jgi:hypothetical protein
MSNRSSFGIAVQIFLCGHAIYSLYSIIVAFPSFRPPDTVSPERSIVEKMVNTRHAGFEVLTAVVLNAAFYPRRYNCSVQSMFFLQRQSQGNYLFSSVSEVDHRDTEPDQASLELLRRIYKPSCFSQTVHRRKSSFWWAAFWTVTGFFYVSDTGCPKGFYICTILKTSVLHGRRSYVRLLKKLLWKIWRKELSLH